MVGEVFEGVSRREALKDFSLEGEALGMRSKMRLALRAYASRGAQL
jgi:hypothetical protein